MQKGAYLYNGPIASFLERINHQEDLEGLYLRLRVGVSQRKSALIHSTIEIEPDTETMLEELRGYLEGWVYEEGDKCFLELMRTKKTNPLDAVAFLPTDMIEPETEEGEDFIEESAVKTLTAALVTMAQDCNHRASVSQQRYLQSLEVMVDAQVEMAHAQAQLAAQKGEDDPSWIKALTAISPAFGPLIGDIAKKTADNLPKEAPAIEEKEEPVVTEPEEDKPPIVASERVRNPLDLRG